MNQLALKEKIGVNYMLLELTGTLNSYTITELQEKLFVLLSRYNHCRRVAQPSPLPIKKKKEPVAYATINKV